MHIPDGYLSPATSVALAAISLPFLYRASKEVQKKMGTKAIPMISVFSAFSFVVMMFNIPLPGGTTGHAVGAAIAAIILGPWQAMISISVSLIIQALFFGDGGILALGANIFNMGILIPLIATVVYRFANVILTGKKRVSPLAAGIAGYIGINVAALATAIELGIQPLFYHDPMGHALYFPYGLAVSIPAMMIGHLTIAGFAEAFVSVVTLGWLKKAQPDLFSSETKKSRVPYRIFAGLFFILILLTPLGLLAPGTAWGEWSREQLQTMGLGYIPKGFEALSSLWSSPFSGYSISVVGNQPVGYILSAILGVGTIILLFSLVWVMTQRRSSKKKGAFTHLVEKTAEDMTQTIHGALSTDEYLNTKGLFQRFDPRTKVVITFGVILAVSLCRSLPWVIGLYGLVVLLAIMSTIPVKFFITRVWFFLPFFAGILALPAIFNVVTPGQVLLPLIHLPTFELSITVPGVVTALFLLFRVASSVSIMLLTLFTTRWYDLLSGLSFFRIPGSFLFLISTTYRYIFVFLSSATDMLLARRSRTVGQFTGTEARYSLLSAIGVLFSKSFFLSEEVAGSMRSRGFLGNVKSIAKNQFSLLDTCAIVVTIGLCFGVLFIQ